MERIDYSINRINLYEQIADKLEQAILRTSMETEHKLPSEQELAKQFLVSRTVIREAMKLLKERGLVILKNGDGSYISKPRTDTVSSAIGRIMHMDHIDNDDLHGMRIILEVASCRLAARNATPDELHSLEQIIKDMENRGLSLSERVQKDADFHITIAHASKNDLLGMFVETMTILLRDYMGKGVLLPGGIEDGLMRHTTILKALESGDPDAAEQAVLEHLRVSRQNVTVYETTVAVTTPIVGN